MKIARKRTIGGTGRAGSELGYTLLEIMLVLGIIAVLLGSAIYLMQGNMDEGGIIRARGDIQTISIKLKSYKMLAGFYPTQEQGLMALVTEPTTPPEPKSWAQGFSELPKDAWGSYYEYRIPGKQNPRDYDLFSRGPDGVAETRDDIGNW